MSNREKLMNTEIPEFLLEMSEQLNGQPTRCTAHPIWQVRCKRYIVTAADYNEHHWILQDDDGELFRSDSDETANETLLERYPDFCKEWATDNEQDFLDGFDVRCDLLPDNVFFLYVQETDEVVSTHLTESDALWFIKRKQHDYPKLYTYVASAYFAPQLRQLQDWIISLTTEQSA